MYASASLTLLLLGASGLATASMVAPSFDTFLQHGLGSWRGVGYTWTPEAPGGESLPLAVAPGYITVPAACSAEVSEVMRSCGGAVQGVKEARQPSGGEVSLNRQSEGTTFFSYGSWAEAPAALVGAGVEELMGAVNAFGISVNIAHNDRTRRRLLCVIVAGQLVACDVAIEGRPEDPVPECVETLLARRLQVVLSLSISIYLSLSIYIYIYRYRYRCRCRYR